MTRMATGRLNWRRIIICGVLAGVVWTVASAISIWYVGAAFNAAVPGNKIFAAVIPAAFRRRFFTVK